MKAIYRDKTMLRRSYGGAVDLQTNLARHLYWNCGGHLATALVGLLAASSVRNLLANLVA